MAFLLNIFLNLKISWKLSIGYAAVGFLLVVGTGVGLYTTSDFKHRLEYLFAEHILPDTQLVTILDNGYQIQVELGDYRNQTSDFGPTQAKIAANLETIHLAFTAIDQSTGDHLPGYPAVKAAWGDYEDALARIEADLKGALNGQASSASFIGLNQRWETLRAALDGSRQNNQRNIQQESKDADVRFVQIVWFLVIAGLTGVAISQVVGVVVSGIIVNPLKVVVTQLLVLSRGESAKNRKQEVDPLVGRKDEIGDLARSLTDVCKYVDAVTLLADQISTGNLVVQVKPRSGQDQLGHALLRMVGQLSRLVKQVALNSGDVGTASKRLAQAASQTNLATGQISTTIQQVADGMNQQNADMNQTIDVIQGTNRAISLVAQGAVEQERAVVQTKEAASQMETAIGQMIRNVQAVSESALESTGRAEESAETLRQTVRSMQEIRLQVEELNLKMVTVRDRSEEIGSIVDVIEEIATKTNILAINATIEAAHAEVQASKLTEEILEMSMVSECRMVNQILFHSTEEIQPAFWADICTSATLDSIMITDAEGVTRQSNDPNRLGWRFPAEPAAQFYPFRQLLLNNTGVFCQPSQPRSSDKELCKYVGISRSDGLGLIQIGIKMSSIKKIDLRVKGFAVVASEVYQLAEQARQSTREIRQLIKGIQASISDAVVAMTKSSREVETGMERASQSGTALKQILEAVKEVSRQVNSALEATSKMRQISQSLAGDVTTFGRIVGKNNTAVSDLNTGYGHITHTMESVASLSQQNSAAAQQVSASSQQMRVQMEEVNQAAGQLEEMAENLEELVTQFQY